MEAMIDEWVKLKVSLARDCSNDGNYCGAEMRTPIEIKDDWRTIEAVEVKICGVKFWHCPACLDKMIEREAERRRKTAKANRLWKKILKGYPRV